MKDHYPCEKFSAAVSSLAVSPKSLQERIANAFAGNLHLLLDHPALAPDTARRLKDYGAAWDAVTDSRGKGTIYVWAMQLSDDEATEIARWIVDTAWQLHRQLWTDE